MTSKMSVTTDDAEAILEYEERDRQKVFDAAESLGCKVIIAKSDELQLDMDSCKWHGFNWNKGEATSIEKCGASIHWTLRKIVGLKVWNSFDKEVEVVSFVAWRSRHGNTHVVLKLAEPLPVFERIILQSILGSDPTRELLNWKRVVDGTENPIVLFRPKGDVISED